MFYKNWPYWLKGGVLLAILCLLLSLLLLIPSKIIDSSSLIENIIFLPQIFGFYIAVIAGMVSFAEKAQFPYIFITTVNIIFYFIIGAIIGLIFEKIKNKK